MDDYKKCAKPGNDGRIRRFCASFFTFLKKYYIIIIEKMRKEFSTNDIQYDLFKS